MKLRFIRDRLDQEMWNVYMGIEGDMYLVGQLDMHVLDNIMTMCDVDTIASEIADEDTINCNKFDIDACDLKVKY